MKRRESHYEALGILREATDKEIKQAYRLLALRFHPDRNPNGENNEKFYRITEAYDALSDPIRRQSYDRLLDLEAKGVSATEPKAPPKPPPKGQQIQTGAVPRAEPRAQPRAEPRQPDPPPSPRRPSADEIIRLTGLLTRGRFPEAERIARRMISQNVFHPIPYAVMGDIARMRGELRYAAEMYAYAVQMDPRNAVYERKHEEMIRMVDRGATRVPAFAPKEDDPSGTLFLTTFAVLLCTIFLVVSRDVPLAPEVALLNTWTWSLLGSLAASGFAVGAGLSASQLLERFNTSFSAGSLVPVAPSAIIGLIAACNFWAAVLAYVLIGGFQRTYNLTVTRLLVGVGLIVGVMSAGAAAQGFIDPIQTFAWGGNVVYCGALVGWLITDLYLEETGRLK